VDVVLGGGLLLAVAVSLCMGRYPIGAAQLLQFLAAGPSGDVSTQSATAAAVFWQVRVPRVLASAIVGAALAGSGVALQSVFRNPLAAPDLLGVSAGAALGAVLGILLGWSLVAMQGAAFAGGLAAVGVAWAVGTRLALRDRILSLVLAGIAIASLLGALIALVKVLADPYGRLPAITFWLLGSFASVSSAELLGLAALCLLGMLVPWALRWQADALALSDDESHALGVKPGAVRLALVIGATLATAATVAVVGVIGWVGLVVPHAARILVGAAFARVLPVSMLLGAVLMVAIDALGRTFAATQLPPGVLTALVGAPVLLLLMVRRTGE